MAALVLVIFFAMTVSVVDGIVGYPKSDQPGEFIPGTTALIWRWDRRRGWYWYPTMPISSNLNETKVSGKWYQIMSKEMPPFSNDSFLDDFVLNIQKKAGGGLSIDMQGRRRRGDNQRCLKTGRLHLVPTQMNGRYTMDIGPANDILENHFTTAFDKSEVNEYIIADTDYAHFLVTKYCLGKRKDGTCSKLEGVAISSRNPVLEAVHLYNAMQVVAKVLCRSLVGFLNHEQSNVSVVDGIVGYPKSDQPGEFIPGTTALIWRWDRRRGWYWYPTMPISSNLNETKVSGKWYQIMSKEMPPFSNDSFLDDFVLNIQKKAGGGVSIDMQGRRKRGDNQKCLETGRLHLVPTQMNGRYTMDIGPADDILENHFTTAFDKSEVNEYIIADTDYAHFLVTKYCLGKRKDGTCSKLEGVAISSRNPALEAIHLYNAMQVVAKVLCRSLVGFLNHEQSNGMDIT
ncbi:uncharacterized protein LOC106154058 [Lingula anatina]|uniref:Uncharacterized protein LOC106154058 n=1 Tax=Lingula anatina TaxID=7574 RepID=A0A1S3HCK5_LINAN|nr:uncharacterized protein LOC106154058 [Lingula anatina]|eukprot:XP_013383743.1 uncharacterized protein LOC106154058 [Lingula anatina]